MFKFLLFSLLFISCSSRDKDILSSEELNRSISIIDEVETEYDFGPTQKENFKYVDKTKIYGLEGYKGYNFNVVDLNSDGYSDLVVLESFYDTPVFLRFNPEKKKFEKFSHNFFEQDMKASYFLFYDFDNDGILDVLVGVLNQKTEIEKSTLAIYKGEIESGNLIFKIDRKRIQIEAGPHATVVPVDYNLDGWLDLYIGNWFEEKKGNPTPVPDILLENKNGIFRNKSIDLTSEYDRNTGDSAYVNATPTYGASICDMDQNGFPDILSFSTNGGSNKLWMNMYRLRKGERYFKDYGKESRFASDTDGNLNPFGGGRSFIGLCADYNDDSIIDVFLGEVSHSYDSSSFDKSSVLTGSRFKFPPKFIRTEYFKESESSLWHQSDKRAMWQDFNNDGSLDLLVDNSGYPPHTRMVLFEQDGTHAFVDRSLEYGINIINPTSSVYLDINQDGKLDLLTGQSNIRNAKIKERIYLFENQTEFEGKSFRFYLKGYRANLWGIGAMLIFKVKSGSEVVYKRRNVEYSYGGLPPQNELGIHFSLKKDETLEWVKVRWPYATSANTSVTSMEKVYHLKESKEKVQNYTLCESGQVLHGKMRGCTRGNP